MYTKKLNTIILLTTKTLNFIIIMFFAVILARLVWWVANPTLNDVYIEKSLTNQRDDSVKYIVNRYPFGVVSKHKEEQVAAPKVVDQIKLVGVYLNTLKASVAFIEISGKTQLYNINSVILGNSKLKAINSDSIVVTEDGNDATVRLGGGSAGSGNVNSSNITSSVMPYMRNDTHQSTSTNQGNQNTSINSDEFKDRRRKMMEEFAHKQANGVNTSNNSTVATNSNNRNESDDED